MISEKLSGVYTKIEDKYFDLLDALDKKGLPVYKYSDFFEDKGIPSMIVTFAIIVTIVLLLSVSLNAEALFGNGQIKVSIKDNLGNPLQNVELRVLDQSENVLVNKKEVDDGAVLDLGNLIKGSKLNFIAKKEGFHQTEREIIIGEDETIARLSFEKKFTGITGQIIISDSITKTKITNGTVVARYDDKIINFDKDSNGIYYAKGVPQDETIILRISAAGYVPVEQEVVFYDSNPRNFSLDPSDEAFAGKSSLVVAVNNEKGSSVEEAKVTVYNKETQTILMDGFTDQGAVNGKIQTGIPLKIIVEKEEYILWNSDDEIGGITLREKEKLLQVVLKKGGQNLRVNVVNDFGLALTDAIVQVYNNGERIAREITTSSGAEFTSLDPEKKTIITAYKEGYLANRIETDISSKESITIPLRDATATNSARLDIFSVDIRANTIPNSLITIDLMNDNNLLPYGNDEIRTNVGGYANLLIELDKTYQITAETSVFKGTKVVTASAGMKDNKVYVEMEKKANVVTINLVNAQGKTITGEASVYGLDGTFYFDGNIENSKMYVDVEDEEVVELNVKTNNLEFTENVYVKNKDEVEVIVYDKESDDLYPEIKFLGLENDKGEKVKGITPGDFYYAKFNVIYPLSADEGGIHVRVGDDSIEFAESQNIAIFGLELKDSEKYYSYSFSGDEVIDRSNQGFENEANKWTEGTIKNPDGSYIAKVKIRASAFTAGKMPIHYRAWSRTGEDYYRSPKDETLGLSIRNEEKEGLYANVETEKITLFESLPECNENICSTFNFIDKENTLYTLNSFEAIKGKVYALETELVTQENDYLQINVSTDSNIRFIGAQTNSFKFMEDTHSINKKESSLAVSVTKNGKQKIRFYFVADSTGTNIIEFSASGTNTIEKTISFNSVEEKELLVELSNEKVMLGRNFTIRVMNDDLTEIEDALVKIINSKGEVVKSTKGNDEDGKGSNGNYRINNDLKAGLYTVEVTKDKHITNKQNLLITTNEVLVVDEEKEIKMLHNQKTKTVLLNIKNESDYKVTNLGVTAEENEMFKITSNPPGLINAGKSTETQVKIEYIGDEDFADETITLEVTGLVEGTFSVKKTSEINAVYNEQLDSSCLEIKPSKVKINMIGTSGSSNSESFEVRNNCETTIVLKHKVKEKTKRSMIAVTAQDITLQPGQSQDISVRAQNVIERTFYGNRKFNYEIIYDSNYLKKRVPVSIEIIDPRIALSYPGQITLFLSQDSPKNKAIASKPIFVSNSSQFPIKDIKFSIDKEYLSNSNVKISVEPGTAVNLNRGQGITPPKLVFAEGKTSASEPTTAKIFIHGKLGELNNRVGENDYFDFYSNYDAERPIKQNTSNTGYSSSKQLLGEINVNIYYSGFDCLKPTIANPIFNLSDQGFQRTAKINVMNTCAEPVKLVGVESRNPRLFFAVDSVVVGVNQTVQTYLSVGTTGNRDTMRLENYPVTLKGLTTVSQSPLNSQELKLNILSGVDFSDEYGKAIDGIKVKVCGGTEERISMPKESSDCAKGYCNGEEAVNYIAEKLDEAIRKAESQAYSAQKTNEKLVCQAKGYCTFSEIGKQVTTFDLYLKNDIVGLRAMEEVFDELSSGSKGYSGVGSDNYMFEYADISDEFLGYITSKGYGKRVFLDDDLEGCGYYQVSINGTFPINSTGVTFDSPALIARVIQKVDTKECRASIENAINFVPKDEGYGLDKTGDLWITGIEGPNSLDGIAEKISKKLFGDTSRVGMGNGNNIILEEGAMTDALAEMCIRGGTKKKLNVKVNSNNTSTSSEDEAFETQIAKMVTEAINGNYGDNCLKKGEEGYSCIKLTDVGKANIQMKLTNNTLIMQKDGGCIDGRIVSTYPQEIEFDLSYDKRDKKFEGINKIIVKDDKTEYYSAEFIGAKKPIEEKEEFSLIYSEESGIGRYEKEIQICAEPGNYTKSNQGEAAYLQSNGTEFVIRAINKNNGKIQSGEDAGRVTISTKTLHPDDLVLYYLSNKGKTSLTNRGEDKPYYFTIIWNDSIDPINSLNDYAEQLNSFGAFEGVVEGENGLIKANETTSAAIKQTRSSAIKGYLGACGATSAACNLALTGGTGVITGALLDCGIPAATVFKEDVVSLFPKMGGVYATLAKMPLLGGIFEVGTEVPKPKNWTPALATGATADATGTAARAIGKYGIKSGLGAANSGVISAYSTEMGKLYKEEAKELIESSFQKLPGGITEDTLADKVAKRAQDKFKESATKAYKEKIARKGLKRSASYGADDLQQIINGSAVKPDDLAEIMVEEAGLSGKSVDEIQSFFESDSTIYKNLDQINPKSSIKTSTKKALNEIDISINQTTGDDALRLRVKDVVDDPIDDIVDDITKELSPNKNNTTILKNKIKQSVKSKITKMDNVGSKLFEPASESTYKLNKTALKNIINESTENILTKNKNLIGSTDDILNKTLGKGFADDLTKAVSKKTPDVAKRGVARRIGQTLKSGGLWKAVGAGIACGLVSNAAGMWAYNSQMEEYHEKMQKEAAQFPDYPLKKGETYSMTLEESASENRLVPELELIDTEEERKEMQIALNPENETIQGKILAWNSKINEKRPEERILQLPLLTTDIQTLRESLEERESLRENKTQIMNLVNNRRVQNILYNYANEEKGSRIELNGTKASEARVFIAIYLLKPTNSQLESELSGKTDKIRKKTIEIMEKTQENDGDFTLQVTSKIAGSSTKGKTIHDLAGEWESLLDTVSFTK